MTHRFCSSSAGRSPWPRRQEAFPSHRRRPCHLPTLAYRRHRPPSLEKPADRRQQPGQPRGHPQPSPSQAPPGPRPGWCGPGGAEHQPIRRQRPRFPRSSEPDRRPGWPLRRPSRTPEAPARRSLMSREGKRRPIRAAAVLTPARRRRAGRPGVIRHPLLLGERPCGPPRLTCGSGVWRGQAGQAPARWTACRRGWPFGTCP
jgi:hypothetical protein